jgi:hypothetical protein
MDDEQVLTEDVVRGITSGKTWGQDVRASGYQRLDKNAASYIGLCGGGRGDTCDLSGLKHLDEECAKAIALFGGSLNLNAIEEVSDEVAAILATQGAHGRRNSVDVCYRGVMLESWSNVTESAGHVALLKHIVKVAAKREQPVVLAGVKRIQGKAARAIGKCSRLTLGVKALDAKAAKALAGVTFLRLPRLEITEEIAIAWSEGSRVLSLGRYLEIDPGIAAMLPGLIGQRGDLELPNVKELNAGVAEVIGRTKRLSFSSLSVIHEDTVSGLLAHASKDSRLQIAGALQIDEASALRLVEYPGDLRLNVELLSARAAEILRDKAGVPFGAW